MKKVIALSFVALISILALTSAITTGSGAPYGHTGSTGDASNCTHCHGGTTTTDNFITTNIPVSGYIAGITYTITITATKSGINKFGFQVTAEDTSNNKAGSFAITNSAETKMVQDEVTHTGNGTTASNNSKTWLMDWTAPASGTGVIGFYSAVNAANGDGGIAGDQIILSTLTIHEDVTNTIASDDAESFINLYPTVASSSITISSAKAISQISIYDAMGKRVYKSELNSQSKKHLIDINKLKSGVYFAHINWGSSVKIAKFIKK